jgi:hypothetical protein
MKKTTLGFATFALILVLSITVRSQQQLGAFTGNGDVGAPIRPGNAMYDAEKQEYTISGAGTNMWAERDEFHFVWRRMRGNFILTANAAFIGKGVEDHRKIGWIVRSSLDADSAQASVVLHGDGLISLQFRKAKGANIEEKRPTLKAPNVLQLERKDDNYIMSVAQFGDPFTSEQVSLDLGDEVYVGLFVCSHNKDVTEKAVFSNVRVTIPARDNFVPYREYIGSNLELMDVATGSRKIIYTAIDSFQAPKLDHGRTRINLQLKWPALSFRSKDQDARANRHGLRNQQQQRSRTFIRRKDAGNQSSQQG